MTRWVPHDRPTGLSVETRWPDQVALLKASAASADVVAPAALQAAPLAGPGETHQTRVWRAVPRVRQAAMSALAANS